MKELSYTLNFILPFLYLGVLYVYYTIFSGKKKSLLSKTTPILLILNILHLTEIITRNIALNTMPLSTVHDAFSFLAFAILLVYTLIELTLNNRASGLFVLSFAFFLEFISSINNTWQPETNKLLTNPYFALHASMAIIGYTALSISAIYALMYILQNRNMKKHKFGILYSQLPAVTYLESMSIRSVSIGIILLGLGILHGHIQASHVLGNFFPMDIKVIVMDSIWLIYLVGYILTRVKHWRGLWMAYLSLGGFTFLLVGGIIIVLLSNSFHKFY